MKYWTGFFSCSSGTALFTACLIFLGSPLLASTPEDGAELENRLAGIEFRSLIQTSTSTTVSLYDPSMERSFWIEVGQASMGIRVESYDSSKELLILSSGEGRRELILTESNIAPATERPTEVAKLPDPPPEVRNSRLRLQAVLEEVLEENVRLQVLAVKMYEQAQDIRSLSREFSDLAKDDPNQETISNLKVEIGREMNDTLEVFRTELAKLEYLPDSDLMLLRGHSMSLIINDGIGEKLAAAEE